MKYVISLTLLALALTSGQPLRAEDRVYKVAVEDNYKPFAYTDQSGRLSGFDVDVAQTVCGRLRITCEILPLPFNEIIPGVQAGKVDIGTAGFAYTEERATRVIFTNRYYRSSSLFIGLTGHAIGDLAPASLQGKKVAVQSDTSQESYLRRAYGDKIQVAPVADLDNVLKAVTDQTADLGFADGLAVYEHMKSDDGAALDFIGDPVYIDDGSSFMILAKGAEDLRDKINQAIDEIRASGEYDRINNKYFDFNVY